MYDHINYKFGHVGPYGYEDYYKIWHEIYRELDHIFYPVRFEIGRGMHSYV